MSAEDRQREYYAESAIRYDLTHETDIEHLMALSWLESLMNLYEFSSILEVGAGTGRLLHRIQQRFPERRCVGVEPVEALREQGYAKGISRDSLIEGNAYYLRFPDNSFDVVAEFAVLHHVRHPDKAIAEMIRVAGHAIFISDSNVWGQGSKQKRSIKMALKSLRLWSLYDVVRTRGQGYLISENDGVFFPSYSVFNNFHQLRSACRAIYMLNTSPLEDANNPVHGAASIALLGLLRKAP